jgi:hypothetical protein
MTAITIPLSDEKLERLQLLANQAGISLEDLACAGPEEWLSRPREDFAAAAE